MVKPEWVRGVARVRVPYLGYVRLVFSEAILAQTGPGVDVAAATPTAPVDGGATNATTPPGEPSPPTAASPRSANAGPVALGVR
ncbi:hypothetical protein ACFQRB_02580 [Halobaculum litoreum]|uniref:Uncharacterized protein n=1 Tax=Halobaculum litoreum TaxID=3031998 RepID=A0ABD5XQF0_9EURY